MCGARSMPALVFLCILLMFGLGLIMHLPADDVQLRYRTSDLMTEGMSKFSVYGTQPAQFFWPIRKQGLTVMMYVEIIQSEFTRSDFVFSSEKVWQARSKSIQYSKGKNMYEEQQETSSSIVSSAQPANHMLIPLFNVSGQPPQRKRSRHKCCRYLG